MTCDETKLSEFFDDELAPDERRIVECHLDGCPACRLALGGFARVRTSLKAYKAPEGFAAVLQERLFQQRKTEARRRTMRRFAWTAAAAIAATVIAVLASLANFGSAGSPKQPHPLRDITATSTPETSVNSPAQVVKGTPFSSLTPAVPIDDTPSEEAAPRQPVLPEENNELARETVPNPREHAIPPPEPPVKDAGLETASRDTATPRLRQESGPAPQEPAQPEDVPDARIPPPVRVAMAPLQIELPQPYFGGTPLDYFSPNLEEKGYKPRDPFVAPTGAANLARGKPVSSSDGSPRLGKLSFATDGEKGYQREHLLELGTGVQWIQIDLEKTSEIYAVLVWHFHAADRVYFDVVVQISDDPDFQNRVLTVYNNDSDDSLGFGPGDDKEYVETYEGRLIDAKGARGRYVRLYSRGNTADNTNHYTEVEVFGIPFGS